MVHEILVAELSFVFIVVVNAIPWLKAYERSVLAVRSPYSDAWRVEAYGNDRMCVLGVENLDGVNLAVVDNDGVVLECFLVERHQATLKRVESIAVVCDASVMVAVYTLKFPSIVKAQDAFYRLILVDARQIEGRVCTNLKMYLP